MRRNVLIVFTILFFNLSLQVIYTQQQEWQPIVDKEKIDRSISSFEKIYDVKILPSNLNYIKENISSPTLISVVTDWENSHNMYFEENSMLILLINLLNSEIEFINKGFTKEKVKEAGQKALISYLDSIEEESLSIDPMSVRVLEAMGIGPFLASPEPNVYGRIYISSNPDKANVYFDGNKRGQTNNKWVLVTGEYSLTLKKQGYHDYNKKIKIEEEENPPLHCDLRKKENTNT